MQLSDGAVLASRVSGAVRHSLSKGGVNVTVSWACRVSLQLLPVGGQERLLVDPAADDLVATPQLERDGEVAVCDPLRDGAAGASDTLGRLPDLSVCDWLG